MFTSDIAVLQRKMLLASKYKPAVLDRSSKADYKVLQHSQIMYGARRENVQSHTEQCDACVLRLRLGHAYVGKTRHLPEGFAGYRL